MAGTPSVIEDITAIDISEESSGVEPAERAARAAVRFATDVEVIVRSPDAAQTARRREQRRYDHRVGSPPEGSAARNRKEKDSQYGMCLAV